MVSTAVDYTFEFDWIYKSHNGTDEYGHGGKIE